MDVDTAVHRLTALGRIAHIAGRFHELHGLSPDEIAAQTQHMVRSIAEVLQTVHHPPSRFNEAPRLTSKQYVMPPELVAKGRHRSLVEHLRSERGNDARTYAGLLLHGVSGTGKTEYGYLLAHETTGKARVVAAPTRAIRRAAEPGMALLNLYRDLQHEAEQTGQYQVVLFDEFDQLIVAQAAVSTTDRHEASDRSSGTGSQNYAFSDTTNAVRYDDVGQELVGVFKQVVGSAWARRVFTIATSNMISFPDPAIHCEGRLEAMRLAPFFLGRYNYSSPGMSQTFHYYVPLYDGYRFVVPQVLQVMAATEERGWNGEFQHVLAQLQTGIIREVFNNTEIPDDYVTTRNMQSIMSLSYLGNGSGTLPDGFGKCNAMVLRNLLRYLGFDLDRMAGKELESLFPALKATSSVLVQDAREIQQSDRLTAAYIAGEYRRNRSAYIQIETAKQALAEFLFPQLRREGLITPAFAQVLAQIIQPVEGLRPNPPEEQI